MSDDGREGFDDGTTRSEGDPRVLLAMNVVLSTTFAVMLTWGLDLLDAVEFTLVNVATLAIILFSVTYLITQ